MNQTSTFPFLAFLATALYAQEGFNAAGGTVIGNEGSVSYSVGVGAQEIQLPYEISEDIDITVKNTFAAYLTHKPNSDVLILQIQNLGGLTATLAVFTLQGKLLHSRTTTHSQTELDMSIFTPGPYLLKLVLGTDVITTFRIIKH